MSDFHSLQAKHAAISPAPHHFLSPPGPASPQLSSLLASALRRRLRPRLFRCASQDAPSERSSSTPLPEKRCGRPVSGSSRYSSSKRSRPATVRAPPPRPQRLTGQPDVSPLLLLVPLPHHNDDPPPVTPRVAPRS